MHQTRPQRLQLTLQVLQSVKQDRVPRASALGRPATAWRISTVSGRLEAVVAGVFLVTLDLALTTALAAQGLGRNVTVVPLIALRHDCRSLDFAMTPEMYLFEDKCVIEGKKY
jgi:hypothetical protein